ncbi:Syntaxin-8 [Acipenser ruthenus]|uniref:Syntaxin-8 n=1 Tax=Acipenser ruthenus TaxID=7906 RepID=A0A444UQ80_ACIRT|nr:Syntaxin-8 [Acipenser ruthenus]
MSHTSDPSSDPFTKPKMLALTLWHLSSADRNRWGKKLGMDEHNEIIDDLAHLVDKTDDRIRNETRRIKLVEKKLASCAVLLTPRLFYGKRQKRNDPAVVVNAGESAPSPGFICPVNLPLYRMGNAGFVQPGDPGNRQTGNPAVRFDETTR